MPFFGGFLYKIFYPLENRHCQNLKIGGILMILFKTLSFFIKGLTLC